MAVSSLAAAAKEISVDAAVATVLLAPDGIFALKEQKKLKAFLCGHVFRFTPEWLWREFS